MTRHCDHLAMSFNDVANIDDFHSCRYFWTNVCSMAWWILDI